VCPFIFLHLLGILYLYAHAETSDQIKLIRISLSALTLWFEHAVLAVVGRVFEGSSISVLKGVIGNYSHYRLKHKSAEERAMTRTSSSPHPKLVMLNVS